MTKPHHLSNQPQAFKSHKYMRAPISFYLPRQVICIAPVTLNPQTQHSHPFPQADAPASKTVLPVPRAYNFFSSYSPPTKFPQTSNPTYLRKTLRANRFPQFNPRRHTHREPRPRID